MGISSVVLDGDSLRAGLCKDLDFNEADRRENMRRVREIAKLFTQAGIVTLVACISPFHDDRQKSRELLSEGGFILVYVDTPLEECQRRDAKGMYAKAALGEMKNFTGLDSPFEPPAESDVVLRGTPLKKAVSIILSAVSMREWKDAATNMSQECIQHAKTKRHLTSMEVAGEPSSHPISYKKKLISIIGMGRSGSSYLSRSLRIFGASHGNHVLDGPAIGNPTGLFEHGPMLELLHKMLREINRRSWCFATPIKDSEIDIIIHKNYNKYLKEQLVNDLSYTDIFAIKDPRITVFIKLYVDIIKSLEVDYYFLFALRNPYDVASSLSKVAHLYTGYNHALFIWMSYYIYSILYLYENKINFLIVDYDEFLQDKYGTLDRIGDFLGLEQLQEEREIFLHKFSDNSLNHGTGCTSNEYIDYDKFYEFYTILKDIKSIHDIDYNKIIIYKNWFECNAKIIFESENIYTRYVSELENTRRNTLNEIASYLITHI